MAKYEPLPVAAIHSEEVRINTQQLPELVHLEDSALCSMIDFTLSPPLTITKESSMDDAIAELKSTGAHCLLVTNEEDQLLGVISKEDLFGEKPIKLLQENRLPRDQVTVNALMVPTKNIMAIEKTVLKEASVGHIVNTLKEHNINYLVVLSNTNENNVQRIYGLFSKAQLRKQLHTEL